MIKKCINEKQHIPEEHIWKIFTQIILALHEWHGRKAGKILHRDIKPGNLFLDSNNNIKLGDFGLSRIMGKESIFAYTNVGTPYYMSPEQIDEQKYNEKSDIWSTGCILYEIASLKPPFEAKTQMSLAIKIKEGKYDKIPKIYSEELWRVITLMLHSEKEKRPSVEDLLNVPQVSLRLRENRLKETFARLKRKEEEMKAKEIKFVELEAELIKQKEEIKAKNRELEEKERIVQEKEREVEELRRKLMEKESISPRLSSDTPKPLGERGTNIREAKKYGFDNSSIYNSLKQEIKDLSNRVNYDTNVQTRLKKQTSWMASKTDEPFFEKSWEREVRKSWISNKSNIGYKSCERKKRKYDDSFATKKSYEYSKNSHTHLSGVDNKENVSKWANYINSSSEALNTNKDHYKTPPFKSYKSKIPENNTSVHTTSYRSRSKKNAENPSWSLISKPFGSKEEMYSENTNLSYKNHKENYRQHFIFRREI